MMVAACIFWMTLIFLIEVYTKLKKKKHSKYLSGLEVNFLSASKSSDK